MSKSFSEVLKEKMQEAGIKPAELARRAGVTKQNIGRILNSIPHPVTGAPPTTTRETVEKIAPILNWDLDDALRLAGFASESPADIKHALKAYNNRFVESDIEQIINYLELVSIKREKESE